jgi:hypothetical protein
MADTSQNELISPFLPSFALSAAEEEEVMKMAAVGFMPGEIAVAMEWTRERRAAFCALAEYPGSDVALLIAAGRAEGRTMPQTKLQEQAKAGNIDAIKTLQVLQANNRFNELVTFLDDDEFTP